MYHLDAAEAMVTRFYNHLTAFWHLVSMICVPPPERCVCTSCMHFFLKLILVMLTLDRIFPLQFDDIHILLPTHMQVQTHEGYIHAINIRKLCSQQLVY